MKTHVSTSCTVCGQQFNDKVALAKHQVEVGSFFKPVVPWEFYDKWLEIGHKLQSVLLIKEQEESDKTSRARLMSVP